MIDDPAVKDIDRPMDPGIAQAFCNIIRTTGKKLVGGYKIDPSGENVANVVVEKFAGDINSWNNLATLMVSLKALISSNKFSYDSTMKTEIKNTQSELRKISFKLKTVRKSCLRNDEALTEIIPEVKSCVDE